jgi:hypothetical protein
MKNVAIAFFLFLFFVQTLSANESFRAEKLLDSNPSVSIRVLPTPDTDRFIVLVTIRDLESGEIVGEPRLIAEFGKEAKLKIGLSDNSTSFTLAVKIDKARNEINYSTELIKRGRTVSQSLASFSLGR